MGATTSSDTGGIESDFKTGENPYASVQNETKTESWTHKEKRKKHEKR